MKRAYVLALLVLGCASVGHEPQCSSGTTLTDGAPAEPSVPDVTERSARASWCERRSASGERVRDGEYVGWYEDGRVAARGTFRAGIASGHWEWHQRDGQLRFLGNMRKGLPEGIWELYGDSGYRMATMPFFNGRLSGIVTQYYESGSVWQMRSFVGGVESGPWMMLNEDGSLSAIGWAQAGEKSGPELRLRSGIPWRQLRHEAGKEEEVIEWDRDGRIVRLRSSDE